LAYILKSTKKPQNKCGSKIENSVHNNAGHAASMKIRGFIKIENFTANNKSMGLLKLKNLP